MTAQVIECGCDPAEHDAKLCVCGHRVVEHNPRAVRTRPCLICDCRRLAKVPHWPGVPVSGWVR